MRTIVVRVSLFMALLLALVVWISVADAMRNFSEKCITQSPPSEAPPSVQLTGQRGNFFRGQVTCTWESPEGVSYEETRRVSRW
ncbi:hypothetical protein [Streptomyces sp. NPDC049881]|uniref:hypothetical protein n=1 Tax=Streptomyces sp. NPDC049881 TaxID=3155778 RepID=UPI0034152ED9